MIKAYFLWRLVSTGYLWIWTGFVANVNKAPGGLVIFSLVIIQLSTQKVRKALFNHYDLIKEPQLCQ